MIKLVIFDLDGVLVDARELHYEALNEALREVDPKFTIGRQEHLSTYDGLSTSKKIEMLSKELFRTIFHNSVNQFYQYQK